MSSIIVGESNAAQAFEKMSGYLRINELNGLIKHDVFFLLHETDSKNIKDALKIHRFYPESKIIVMLIDPRLGNKVQAVIKNFEYFIPSKLVAKKFVTDISDAKPTELKFKKTKLSLKLDPWVKKALKVLFLILMSSTIFFKIYFGYSFVNALYFTLVQMITGGDTTLLTSPLLPKLVAALVMISGILGIALTVALIYDFLLERKQELIWGIRKFKGKNHIIVVGGGSVGYHVIKFLIESGEKVVLIDKNLNGVFVKTIIKKFKVPFILGDATNRQVLIDGGLGDAKALIAVTDNDLINLEIGLDTKTLDQDLRVVLRIFDTELTENLKNTELIEHTHSMSNTAAEYLYKKILNG